MRFAFISQLDTISLMNINEFRLITLQNKNLCPGKPVYMVLLELTLLYSLHTIDTTHIVEFLK